MPGLRHLHPTSLSATLVQPAFTAVYGYEVIQVLASALEKTSGQAEGLADALSNLSDCGDDNRNRGAQ